jgi:hypothetical protein
MKKIVFCVCFLSVQVYAQNIDALLHAVHNTCLSLDHACISAEGEYKAFSHSDTTHFAGTYCFWDKGENMYGAMYYQSPSASFIYSGQDNAYYLHHKDSVYMTFDAKTLLRNLFPLAIDP